MCLLAVGTVMLGAVTNSTEVADNPWLMNFLIDCGKFVLAAIGGGVIAMKYAEKFGVKNAIIVKKRPKRCFNYLFFNGL